MKRTARTECTVAVALGLLAVAVMAAASPSGLNNIPTADVAPPSIFVFQQYTNFGPDQGTAWNLGAKMGAGKDWEVGFDAKVANAPTGPMSFQVKHRFELGNGRTAIGLGLANINSDEDRGGRIAPYGVVSHAFDGWRLHAGFMGQQNNEGWFAGADATVSRGLTLRTDWAQTNNYEDSVYSFGAMYELSKDWVVEAWASIPSADNADNSYMLKFDYVVPFGAAQ